MPVKVVFLILLFMLLPVCSSGQVDTLRHKADSVPDKVFLLQKVERGGETLPEVEIREVTIFAKPKSKSARRSKYRQYERLIYNIKRVYPYALMVRAKLESVNEELKKIEGDRERKNYLKSVEKDVFAEYEDDMRNMTMTQGRILIKLIDRETQNTSYELIKEYRGKFSAAFWQSIARIFGTNLKAEYDPLGEDALIESIIMEIDSGRL